MAELRARRAGSREQRGALNGDDVQALHADGDPVQLIAATLANPSQGSVTVNPNGTLLFTPAANFGGTALITYTVTDPSGAAIPGAVVRLRNVETGDT